MRSPLRLFGALVALLLLLSACGGGGEDDTVTILQLGADAVPSQILDLRVEQEDVEERLEGAARAYVEATGLYSLREDDRLQATLQVSHFRDDVEIDRKLRLAIVNQIGSTAPTQFRMGDEIVYLTSSKRQAVAIYFEERSFVVLSTLETFESSRSLLREVTELDL